MNSFCVKIPTFTKDRKTANEISYIGDRRSTMDKTAEENMNLTEANLGEEYIIKEIVADDEELVDFLFSLGCYGGEPITVVSRLKSGCVVSIKDGRYNIDKDLAAAIIV